eukprot:287802_1
MAQEEKKLEKKPVKGDDPYSLQHIFQGKGKHFGLLKFKNENEEENKQNDENDIIKLPFQEAEKWAHIQKIFETDINKFENELKYLQYLFKQLASHPADKFTSFLQKLKDKNQTFKIYSTFIKNTLPFMINQLILNMPSLFNKDYNLKILKECCNKKVTLTRGQIASLLAACFFSLIAEHCSFACELNTAGFKGKFNCWIHYFEYVRMKGIESDWFNKETVTVYRRCMSVEQLYPILAHNNLLTNETQLCEFTVHHEGCIEDDIIAIHSDFANMLIGGGVLNGGRVQEEIRFTINSECVISKLLCPDEMRNNESIIILGSQQFFNYSGYGYKFKFNGYRNIYNIPIIDNRLATCIVGIDAIHFYYSREQCNIDMLIREISKCYIGYCLSNDEIGYKMDIISTGNWGCGIFQGDPMVKAMIQWISVSLSKRKISYYTFKDKRVVTNLEPLIKAMINKKITVGKLWEALTDKTFAKEYENDEIGIMGHLARYLHLEFV